MKVAIVGYGLEGKTSYDYYQALGADITICDRNGNQTFPENAKTQVGEHYLDNLAQFDLLVRTAGMPPHVILDTNPTVVAKITTQVDQFLAVCPTRNIIGITGTKGKGTTSTLIANMLKAAGKSVWLGGNIGVPPFTFIDKLDESAWVVLELSSFQLMDVRHSPHIAVCLMVVPEHLNWHRDMAEYVRAKSHLFAYQNSDDIAVYYPENAVSTEIASAGAGHKLSYYRSPGAWVNGNMITIDGEEVCRTDELQLLGKHNWQNVCAAVTAVWQAGITDIAAIRSVLTSFSGLEHRLEFVRTLDDVQYYDDSFGTTPETAIVAMEAFTQSKIVILGGSDKGASYDTLATAVLANNVRAVLLIGDQADAIQAALDAVGFTAYLPGGDHMEAIVAAAQNQAKPGDIVLLSTGCASFGMFRDYKDRGKQFVAAVNNL